jgi:hypothetical protein
MKQQEGSKYRPSSTLYKGSYTTPDTPYHNGQNSAFRDIEKSINLKRPHGREL